MSVRRERERDNKLDRTRRGFSDAKKIREDQKSTTTRDKPTKTRQAPTTKDSTQSISKKSETGDGKHSEKHHGKASKDPATVRPGKTNSKTDLLSINDVIEKKVSERRKENRPEDEKKGQENRKTTGDHIRTSNEDEKAKMKRDRTRTRTLSPTEIKQLLPPKIPGGDFNQGIEDCNGTAKTSEIDRIEADEEEYENDFEDYESDFEEDDSRTSDKSEPPEGNFIEESSTEDEEMQRQTGNEETESPEVPKEKPNSPASWKQTAQTRHFNDIKVSIRKENTMLEKRRQSLTNSTSSTEKPHQDDRLAVEHFIDFSLASKIQKQQKNATAARKRGRELLDMITLDTITYNILEIPPIPYENYMATFGKSNTKQVYVQTNEDVLEEESQTEEISTCTKWTQCPTDYLGRKRPESNSRYFLTKEERLGVGGEGIEKNQNDGFYKEVIIQSQTGKLLNFLTWSSQVVLAALERKSGNYLDLENMPHRAKDIAFADGFSRLHVREVPPLSDRAVSHLCLMNEPNKKLLTVHVQMKKEFQRCLIGVWSFSELSKPLKILVASNRVTSCTFGPNQGHSVLAGLSDGSVCLWDLREPSVYHSQASEDSKWVLQSPTYTTAGDIEENNHSAGIISIKLLGKMDNGNRNNDFVPSQVCSLDKNGTIVIWSVIQLDKSFRTEPSEDVGLAHWGRLKLIKTSSFSIFGSLREEMPSLYITCNDMIVNQAEDDGFYIANSFGSVNHVSSYGSVMKPKFFVPSKQDSLVEATCLELCPFDGNYFLVGCGDGSIRLHSRHQERPLTTLNSYVAEGERQTAVAAICWLNTRPCVIFALDSRSRIHVWDLTVSDMYPEMTLLLAERKILSMKLLTDSNARQVPFIVLGMEDGSVEIHKIKSEYGRRTTAEVANEKKMFLKYVRIL